MGGQSPRAIEPWEMLARVKRRKLGQGAALSSTLYTTDHGDIAVSTGRSTTPSRVSKAQGTRE
jgi:hypothetical protein